MMLRAAQSTRVNLECMYLLWRGMCARAPSETHEFIYFASIEFCFQKTMLYMEFMLNSFQGHNSRNLTRDQIKSHFHFILNTFILDPSKIILESSSGNETQSFHLVFPIRIIFSMEGKTETWILSQPCLQPLSQIANVNYRVKGS